MKRGVRRAEAVLLWPQVVGAEVAKFSRAKSLQDGVLIVEVSDSETAMHLSFQRQRFLDVYWGKFGVKDVRDLRFWVGRSAPTEKPQVVKPQPPVDPKALAKLARDLGQLELPDKLAAPTMQAAKALLARRARLKAQGWYPCPTCEALTPDDGLCDVCQRYMNDAKVKTASHRLAVDPEQSTPLLSEDERQVAIYLAKSYLAEKLQELLPQVLADPDCKPQLELATRNYLAHVLHKAPAEVSDNDLDRLEPRIARALGRWG